LEASAEALQTYSKATFGIKKVRVKRPGVPLILDKCDATDTRITRFMVESVEDFDVSTFVPGQIARQQFQTAYTSVYKLIQSYILQFNEIKMTILKARGISDQLATIQSQLESFFGLYRSYSKFFTAHLKKIGAMNKDECPGCDAESYAESCDEINAAFPLKPSGFYYVKSYCMPAVQRVYCVMRGSLGANNFYLFHGDLINKKSQFQNEIFKVEDIGKICGNHLGLEPVDL